MSRVAFSLKGVSGVSSVPGVIAVPVVAAVSTVVGKAVSFTDVASKEGGGDLPVGLTHSRRWWLRTCP